MLLKKISTVLLLSALALKGDLLDDKIIKLQIWDTVSSFDLNSDVLNLIISFLLFKGGSRILPKYHAKLLSRSLCGFIDV